MKKPWCVADYKTYKEWNEGVGIHYLHYLLWMMSASLDLDFNPNHITINGQHILSEVKEWYGEDNEQTR